MNVFEMQLKRVDDEYRNKVRSMMDVDTYKGSSSNRVRRRYTYEDITNYLDRKALPSYCITVGQRKHFKDLCKGFCYSDKTLYYINLTNSQNESQMMLPVVVDRQKQFDILCSLHFGANFEEHRSREVMTSFLENHYYWFSITDDVRSFVRCCFECYGRNVPQTKITSASLPHSALNHSRFGLTGHPRNYTDTRMRSVHSDTSDARNINSKPTSSYFMKNIGNTVAQRPHYLTNYGTNAPHISALSSNDKYNSGKLSGFDQVSGDSTSKLYSDHNAYDQNKFPSSSIPTKDLNYGGNILGASNLRTECAKHSGGIRLGNPKPGYSVQPISNERIDANNFKLAYKAMCDQVAQLEYEIINATNGRVSSQSQVQKYVKQWNNVNTFTLAKFARNVIEDHNSKTT